MDTWTLWMVTKDNATLCNLDNTLGFEFLRVAGQVGSFQVIMPDDFDDTLLLLDNRIEIWRVFPGLSALAFCGLVRGWKWKTDKTGATTLTIKGQCINHLLSRRVLVRGYST